MSARTEEAAAAERLTLTIAEIRAEADGVVSLRLVSPSGDPLPAWQPGAHLDVHLEPGLDRQYSLCGDPTDERSWTIAVLREPESRGGSEFVHTRLAAGQALAVTGPRNNFPLVEAERHLLIAGGIGVTPMLAMARELERRGRPWKMLYGGREAASMAFVDALRAFGDRVEVRPQDEHGLLDLDGFLGAPTAGTAVYCCGPEALLGAVEERCAAWPPGTLHVERFRARPGALDGPGEAFEVTLEGQDLTVTVGPDQSIVDALEAAGVSVATSCREGTCGTCETTVLEGVPDHRDSYLTAEEKADNETMMICCSRAKTPRLVIELF